MRTQPELQPNDFTFLVRELATGKYRSRMQTSIRRKSLNRAYCIAKVTEAADGSLDGHLSGPSGCHASFSAFRSKGTGKVQIRVKPEESCTVSDDQLKNTIVVAVKNMIARAKSEDYSGPRSRKGMKGFYLKSSGPAQVGESYRLTLQQAVKAGEISEAFKDGCIEFGFGMIQVA